MPEKRGGGGKPQRFDKTTGRYGGDGKIFVRDEHVDEILAHLKQIYETVDTADEPVPRSLSAKAKNYDIRMPDGTIAHLVEGTYIANKHVFSGFGTKSIFRDAEKYVAKHGGVAEDWAKVKGNATLEQSGKTFEAEIHWCENPKLGIRDDFKFKRYL